MAPFVANAREWIPGLPRVVEWATGFAAERALPRFRGDAFQYRLRIDRQKPRQPARKQR